MTKIRPPKNDTLTTIGVIELLVASVISYYSIKILLDMTKHPPISANDETKADIYLGLIITSPCILFLFIMAITAIWQPKKAMTIQLIGVGLFIGFVLLIFT